MEAKEMQQVLASKLLGLCYDDKISKRIELMEYTLEIINYLKNNEIEEKELVVFSNLIKETFLYGAEERESMSSKYKKYYQLTEQLKEEITINNILIEDEPIIDLNSWIRTLKIFRISDKYNDLEEKTYENSYELYQTMRKIVLKRGSTKCKRIYVGIIVERLEKTLPKNIQIHESDYELSQIIKLVKNNSGFGYGNSSIGILSGTQRHRLERHSKILRVKTLVKNLKN